MNILGGLCFDHTESYRQLGIGSSTDDDAKRRFGSEGAEQRSGELGGNRIATYEWITPGQPGRVVVGFQDGRLVSRSQAGTK